MAGWVQGLILPGKTGEQICLLPAAYRVLVPEVGKGLNADIQAA